jgi:hypothetical protein
LNEEGEVNLKINKIYDIKDKKDKKMNIRLNKL